MAEKIGAAEALAGAQKKRFNKKKAIIIGSCAGGALVIGASVFTAISVVNSSKIEKAKAVVTQIDINSTYKSAEFDENGDWDSDGVTNGRETSGGTNVQNEDTDQDGISDGDEESLGTDPLKADSDGDGLLDGYEIMAGLDPLNSKSDGSTDDSQRKVTIQRRQGDIEFSVTGSANIADVTVEEMDIFSITSNPGIVSPAYDIYSDHDFDTAELTFTVDPAKAGSDTELTILRFDPDTHTYEKIDSAYDKSAKTVKGTVSGKGTYVVGIAARVNEEQATRIAFLVDNSGSMYAEYSGNDVDFKRVDFAKDLIAKLEGDYSFSVAKFTADYTLLSGFTNDTAKLNKALDSIKTDEETFNGTHSQSAIENCLAEFAKDTSKDYRDIIVMLTDGESDEENGKSLDELVADAKAQDTIILTVGLGKDTDREWLQGLAYETEGKYFSAADADALTQVYEQIATTLNYNEIKYSDSDDKIQGYLVYDTGFRPENNGFTFKNFRTSTCASVDFGMAVMARDWYIGQLSPSLGAISPADQSSQKYDAAGYDFKSTDIEELYNSGAALKKILPTALVGNFGDVKYYLDFKSSGDTLKVEKNKRNEAESAGWAVTRYPIDSTAIDWKYVELLSLDIAGSLDRISTFYNKTEAQLYSALYRLNALQWDDANEEFNLNGGNEGFERLKGLLAQGIPVVTTIDDTHTVNVISLIQDSSNHRSYIMQVYDNNYPDKIKEIYLTKSPIGSYTISDGKATLDSTTYEYSATYEGKQVGLEFSDVKTH
ncbi:MAG: VWA domain-containing protein [Ruminococcus sp.]|nr:VWA domain-containing protein [Ruminococcus sp.]